MGNLNNLIGGIVAIIFGITVPLLRKELVKQVLNARWMKYGKFEEIAIKYFFHIFSGMLILIGLIHLYNFFK